MTDNRTINILLIDDDEDDYLLTQDLIKEIGNANFKLEWASSYEAGLKDLLSHKHQVYLVDYRLGAHTGLELLKEAQKQNLRTPIILLTGQGDHSIDNEAMKAGAADYLVKTQISAPLLERCIRYCLNRSQAIQDTLDREENFRRLFNASFEGIIVHENGIILDANNAIENIFGYSTQEIIGTHLFDYSHESTHEILRTKFQSESEHNYESIGLKKDKTRVSLEISCKPYLYKGKQARLMAVRDIGERKFLQAQLVQQDRLASVGFLASGLAHEIGTPLGVIRGRAEYMAMYPGDQESLRTGMEIIIAQIDRISKLIHSLLNLARKESSDTAVAISFNEALDDVTGLMLRQLEKHSIQLIVNVPPDVRVKAVRSQLEQVLLNLIINSTHAIQTQIKKKTGSTHLITVGATEKEKSWEISVKDTGCGIPPENLRHIFDAFFTTKEPGVGTGLGLSITQQLILSWGGNISCDSIEGHGATFIMRLPKV